MSIDAVICRIEREIFALFVAQQMRSAFSVALQEMTCVCVCVLSLQEECHEGGVAVFLRSLPG